MIASRLVLWHNYYRGAAVDLSENRNHGQLENVHLGTGAFATDLQFSGGTSAVVVAPSSTLTNLRTLRAQVQFHWDPSAPNNRRHNLIEGHVSFALFVNPDGSLQGTVRSQVAGWIGAQSAPGTVSTGHWHLAELVHDGISSCTLYLDGHVVAQDFSSPGPVQSVGSHGIAIGHWPEPDGRYTLEGYIRLVRVWVDDPAKDAGQLVDDCCIDRAAIAELPPIESGPIILLAPGPAPADEPAVTAANAMDDQQLGDMVRSMLDIGRQAASHMAQGTSDDRDHAYGLSQQLLTNYATGDQAGMQHVMGQAADLLRDRAPSSLPAQLFAQLGDVMAPVPMAADIFAGRYDLDEAATWFDPWCLSQHLPPRPKHRAPGPASDHSTDNGTDAAAGTFPGDNDQHEQVPAPPPAPPSDHEAEDDR